LFSLPAKRARFFDQMVQNGPAALLYLSHQLFKYLLNMNLNFVAQPLQICQQAPPSGMKQDAAPRTTSFTT